MVIAARLVWLGSVVRSAVSAGGVVVVSHQADAVDDARHLAGDERHVGRARSIGADGGHWPEAEILAHLVVDGEQPRVALGRRQRGIAVCEGQRRLGLRQRVRRRPPAWPGARLSSWSFDSVRRSPVTMARSATTFFLPNAVPAALGRVEIDRRSAEHHAGVERQVLLARELPAEAVENSRRS